MATETEKLLLQIDAQTTLLRQELAKAQQIVEQSSKRIERSASDAGNAITGIGTASVASLKNLAGLAAGLVSMQQAASFVVRANADFQKLSAIMEVATGSTSAAAGAMKDLERFASETPFTLNQVVEAYVKLKSMGLDPSIEAMRSFGNTSAAMGKDIMQFIEAIADAATGEFERLKEFGIKASKEGDNVKFTFQGVTTTVQNNAQAITEYLRGLGDESGVFAGSMSKQMETISGKFSNLEDAASRFAVTIGQLGFNDFFMAQIDKVTTFFDRAAKEMKGFANIKNAEGIGAAMGTSEADAQKAGTASGMQQRLRDQVKAAEAERKRIEAARARGSMFEGGQASLDRARGNEAAARKRLADFTAGNWAELDPLAATLPVNIGKGSAPAPRPSGAGKKTSKTAGKAGKPAAASWGEQARAGTFFDPGPNAVDAFMAKSMPEPAAFDTTAMLADLEKVNTQIDLINVKPIQPISPETLEMTRQFAENLTSGLAQAIIYGQDIGKALVNSIKAAAAQLIASKLLNLLGGGLGKIFGGGSGVNIFKRESGGPVKAGQPYLVGEKRPEIFVPNSAGYIQPRVPQGKSGGQDGMVRVSLDQGLVATMVAGAVQVADARGAERMRQSVRTRMPQSPGA